MSEQGDNRSDTEKRKTAIHEAGHAVCHHRLGIEQDQVTIQPHGLVVGASTAAGESHVWSRDDAADQVMAYLAGYAAMIAAGYSEVEAEAGADDDFEHAERLIADWLPEASLPRSKQRAVELMAESANRNAVAFVVEELLIRGTIDGQLLDLMLGYADGDITEAEYRQALLLHGAIL